MILHSDGLATSWTLDRYPNLAALHPSLIAAILYRDFTRASRRRDRARGEMVRLMAACRLPNPGPSSPSRSRTRATSSRSASARAASPSCSDSTGRTRRGSPPRSRRSRATLTAMPAAAAPSSRSMPPTTPQRFADSHQRQRAGHRRSASSSSTGSTARQAAWASASVGARRLMDTFSIDSKPGKGTTVEVGHKLPPASRHGRAPS